MTKKREWYSPREFDNQNDKKFEDIKNKFEEIKDFINNFADDVEKMKGLVNYLKLENSRITTKVERNKGNVERNKADIAALNVQEKKINREIVKILDYLSNTLGVNTADTIRGIKNLNSGTPSQGPYSGTAHYVRQRKRSSRNGKKRSRKKRSRVKK
tara:strand:+ start:2419 stop:2889 length:471 start_codon:yes stop_codon:yes gene_type:complete